MREANVELFGEDVINQTEEVYGLDEEGEIKCIETDFSMVDGKEQDGITQWVKRHKHMFGKDESEHQVAYGFVNGKLDLKGKGRAPPQPEQPRPQGQEDSEDEDDSDFVGDSESDGGSATSDSDNDSEGGSGDEDGEGEEDEAGSGTEDEDDRDS